jgi:hypothetical protein
MTKHRELIKPRRKMDTAQVLAVRQDSPCNTDKRRQTFVPTDAAAGSPEKIEVLRWRMECGLPLWHDEDRHDYTGLTGAVHPRKT